jgi:hypothetical protein
MYNVVTYLEGDAKFDWDEQNIAHIARHEVTPGEFEQVVSSDPTWLYTQTDEQSGEERMVCVGTQTRFESL